MPDGLLVVNLTQCDQDKLAGIRELAFTNAFAEAKVNSPRRLLVAANGESEQRGTYRERHASMRRTRVLAFDALPGFPTGTCGHVIGCVKLFVSAACSGGRSSSRRRLRAERGAAEVIDRSVRA